MVRCGAVRGGDNVGGCVPSWDWAAPGPLMGVIMDVGVDLDQSEIEIGIVVCPGWNGAESWL